MKKLAFPFSQIIHDILDKDDEMFHYSHAQMQLVKDTLANLRMSGCPVHCNDCCRGSVLMSYLEYLYLLSVIFTELGREDTENFFAVQLGLMEEDNMLLCPFLDSSRANRHCTQYPHRPLICRVFGTTASPCQEEMEHAALPEKVFYQLYHALHYLEDGSFIGLPLTETLALYEAPFAIWAIADSGRTEELQALFAQYGSMRAVICDLTANRFFTILPGGTYQYLDEPSR